jgi:hypothetical protein
MKLKIFGILVMLLIWSSGIVLADWEEGDGHKMHFPQLPDPNGWDVNFIDIYLGDDWRCSETGYVEDIHFWYSWQLDIVTDIPWIYVSIWSNDPNPPSRPKELLWERNFYSPDFIIAGPWFGNQGWYDPGGGWDEDDHEKYWQINIPEIDDPFEQHEDTIYWLVIHMPFFADASIGWKTSLENWNDNAVYGMPGNWFPLWDPINPTDPIDFAFVITGEPKADLVCVGAIDWERVNPEDYVLETFGVANNGDTGSLLDWFIAGNPSWGSEWTFTPASGTGLLAGDSVTVDVSVKAPSTPNEEFSGEITVCNSADPTDCCTIPVTMTTPRVKNAIYQEFIVFLQTLLHRFPILEKIITSKNVL